MTMVGDGSFGKIPTLRIDLSGGRVLRQVGSRLETGWNLLDVAKISYDRCFQLQASISKCISS